MTKGPIFSSTDEDVFWDELNTGDKEAISSIIQKDCSKGIRVAVFIIVLMSIAFAWGVFAFAGGTSLSARSMLVFIMAPLVLVPIMTDSIVKTLRYSSKAKEYRFRCAHVRVDDRVRKNGLTSSDFTMVVSSTDEEKDLTATIRGEMTLFEKMPVGITGRLVLLEDEDLGYLVSPYWFMADQDPRYKDLPPVRS